MKKEYIKPQMTAIEIQNEQPLLADSCKIVTNVSDDYLDEGEFD